jgi:tRNA modification GTPase
VFNALAGADRAIVTDVPGTTRDLVTEVIDVDGVAVTLVDTTGLRESSDIVEAEGIARSHQAVRAADLVLQVVDQDEPQQVENRQLIVQNKIDLGRPARGVCVSAKTGEGFGALRAAIVGALDVDLQRERPAITNVRHAALLERAAAALERARAAAGDSVAVGAPERRSVASVTAMSEEFVLADLQDARAALEEVTGRRTPDDLLAHIFSRFCVGK